MLVGDSVVYAAQHRREEMRPAAVDRELRRTVGVSVRAMLPI